MNNFIRKNLQYSWVLIDEIAVGEAPKREEDLDSLEKIGIKSILTLCSEEEVLLPSEIGVRFSHLRSFMPDHNGNRLPTTEEVKGALSKLNSLLNKGAVYVHCYAGIERSPLLCMAWLMTNKKLDQQTSLEYMMQTHPKTNPLAGQLNLLKTL